MNTEERMLIILVINGILTGCNVIILGLAVKLYSEATKTHIFTTNKKGI